MKPDELVPLPDDVQSLLARAERPVPSPGFEARVLGRIQATLGPAGDGGGGGGGAPASGTSLGASGGVLTTGLAAKMGAWGLPVSAATLVIGAVAGSVTTHMLATVRASLSAPPEVTQALSAPVERPPQRTFEQSERDSTPPPPKTTSKKDSPSPQKPAAGPSRDVALAAERGFVEVARTAMGRREVTRALTVLEEHGRRFPDGQLVEERESLMVQALVLLQRHEEAKKKAAAFRKAFPDSMLLPAVEAMVAAP